MKMLFCSLLVLAATLSAQQLPNAPDTSAAGESGVSGTGERLQSPVAGRAFVISHENKRPVADRSFLASTAALFATSIANVELSHQCVQERRCSLEQLPSGSRAGMYAVTLPIGAGAALLSYKLKQHGRRWWFVPSTTLTGAHTYSLAHAASRMSK